MSECTEEERVCPNGDCAYCQSVCRHDNLIEEELTQYGQGICADCLKYIPRKYLSDEELELLNNDHPHLGFDRKSSHNHEDEELKC